MKKAKKEKKLKEREVKCLILNRLDLVPCEQSDI